MEIARRDIGCADPEYGRFSIFNNALDVQSSLGYSQTCRGRLEQVFGVFEEVCDVATDRGTKKSKPAPSQ